MQHQKKQPNEKNGEKTCMDVLVKVLYRRQINNHMTKCSISLPITIMNFENKMKSCFIRFLLTKIFEYDKTIENKIGE